ncbi:hypothetical protein [Nocardioides kribbensis]|uniref:ATP-binding protein n=1 Tax=Nocardioides kribbensis TaxID=305517 RepID=A0ABV1P0Q6_9ACTN
MSLLLHLNGPPGIGKSALAARWADAHPGTLLLDLDVGGLDEAASLRALEHLVRRAVPGWGA